VLVFVLLLAVAAVVLGFGSLLFGARRGFDDVERFHRARGITTGWARDATTRPLIASPRQSRDHDSEQEPATR